MPLCSLCTAHTQYVHRRIEHGSNSEVLDQCVQWKYKTKSEVKPHSDERSVLMLQTYPGTVPCIPHDKSPNGERYVIV